MLYTVITDEMFGAIHTGGGKVPKKPMLLQTKILIFIAAAALVFFTAFIPSVLRTVMFCERGREAQAGGRHSTAIKEYRQARQQFPDSAEITARLAISYFYNEKTVECRKLLNEIAGRKVSGKVSRQVNTIIEKLDSVYYESNGLRKALELYGQEELERTAGKVGNYLASNKNDIMGIFHLANINFDMGRYSEAEKLYLRAVELQPEFYSAYLNLAAVYRETSRYEKAEGCCRKVLQSSKEHPQAFVSLSKIEFARYNYKAGLEYAEKAYEYDSSDLSVISNLSLAFHYNNKTDERDKLYKVLKQNNYYDTAALQSIFEAGIGKRK
jgi:tetratricopeptide (TPR) repeat protein